jgi:hypothetical protein
LWCHSSAILRPWRVSLSINWIGFIFVTKFRIKFSIFNCCLIFVWIRGVQPAA